MKRGAKLAFPLPCPPHCLAVSNTHQHLLWAQHCLGQAWGTELMGKKEQLNILVRELRETWRQRAGVLLEVTYKSDLSQTEEINRRELGRGTNMDKGPEAEQNMACEK